MLITAPETEKIHRRLSWARSRTRTPAPLHPVVSALPPSSRVSTHTLLSHILTLLLVSPAAFISTIPFLSESLNFLIEIRDKYSGEGRREREEA